jgi:hypothetical protein
MKLANAVQHPGSPLQYRRLARQFFNLSDLLFGNSPSTAISFDGFPLAAVTLAAFP